MKTFSSLALCGFVFLLTPAVFANAIRQQHGQVQVTLDVFDDAYGLFEKLGVSEERADQGFHKHFEACGAKDSLTIDCTFDHRSSCELAYKGRVGEIIHPSREVSAALYDALAMAPITGFGQSRKFFITSDARLQIECTVHEAQPGKPHCMLEIIKGN